MTNIVLIQGHPDAGGQHLGHALEQAYAEGAREAGHEVKAIHVAELDFGFLRSKEEWQQGEPVADIKGAQDKIAWANHIVIFYPLWLGTMPAILKAFLEQSLRPGFALNYGGTDGRGGKDGAGKNAMPKKLLSGKSGRVVVTMGMPALAYRLFFRAHSLKSLERNILKFCGITPIGETLIGMVENIDDEKRKNVLNNMRALGRKQR